MVMLNYSDIAYYAFQRPMKILIKVFPRSIDWAIWIFALMHIALTL